MNQVGELHSLAICVLARMKDVPIEINGLVRIRQDGRDSDLIAILDLEIIQGLVDSLSVVGLRHVDLQRGVALVRDHTLDFNVAEGPRSQHASGKLQSFSQGLFISQFVNGGVHYHPGHCNFRPHGRNLDCVTRLNSG